MPRQLITALTLACALVTPSHAEPWSDWQTTLHADNDIAGIVWDTRAATAVEPDDLIDRLAQARFALVGEVHDNPDHHRLQGWIIAQLAQAGASPTIVMEMISRDQEETLSEYLSRPDASAQGLGPALAWGESGWPAWPNYQPIAEAALLAKLSIVAGNPSRAITRQTAQQGLDSLSGERRAALGLDDPLSPALAEALSDELYDGHCQLIAREKLAPMASIQRLRDAFMAEAMVNAGREGAVLIAGNGHVRADRGVPWYLRRRAPDNGVAVLMLVELNARGDAPGDYVETGPNGAPLADFIWLTPRAERPDPCEQMRRMFEKRGRD